MPRIGAMRERVVIQAGAGAADGYGGRTSDWSAVATVWAEVAPIGGRERAQAEQLEGVVTHRVTIRHRTDVTAAHRLLWGSKALNVRAVTNPDQRRRYLDLLCEEGTAT